MLRNGVEDPKGVQASLLARTSYVIQVCEKFLHWDKVFEFYLLWAIWIQHPNPQTQNPKA